MKYDVHVTRDGRWWMLKISALGGLTQARKAEEVELMAREYIAVTLDVPLSSVELGEVTYEVGSVVDVGEVASQVADLRKQAAEAEERAGQLTRDTVQALLKAEVPMRDIGALLGISYQRVGQLAQARPTKAASTSATTAASTA